VAEKILGLGEGFDPENVLILWKGYYRWQELGYPIND
jgi:hypothetical protein